MIRYPADRVGRHGCHCFFRKLSRPVERERGKGFLNMAIVASDHDRIPLLFFRLAFRWYGQTKDGIYASIRILTGSTARRRLRSAHVTSARERPSIRSTGAGSCLMHSVDYQTGEINTRAMIYRPSLSLQTQTRPSYQALSHTPRSNMAMAGNHSLTSFDSSSRTDIK